MLQVFSDFDFTISRLWLDDGAKGPSSHGVIEAALPGQFNVVAKQIFDTYYPIEIDPTLTIEEKVGLWRAVQYFKMDFWTVHHLSFLIILSSTLFLPTPFNLTLTNRFRP